MNNATKSLWRELVNSDEIFVFNILRKATAYEQPHTNNIYTWKIFIPLRIYKHCILYTSRMRLS